MKAVAVITALMLAGVTTCAVTTCAADPEPEQAEEQTEPEKERVNTPKEVKDPEKVEQEQIQKYGCVIYGRYGYPWNQIAQDWEDQDIEGFWYHTISPEAQHEGGEFPVIAQIYTYILCRDAGLDYEVVFALIEKESKCRYDCIGDSGDSIGLMQINERWHRDLMEEQNAPNLLNPYMNLRVGIAHLKNLYEETGDTADMLTAYNMGIMGARENLWSRGVHDYPYTEDIMKRAQILKSEKPAAEE